MPDEFDPRDYMASGDWEAVLAQRGWHRAPADLHSTRKDYKGNGWQIHVWADAEGPEHDNDARIIAFGPNGDMIGDLWLEHFDVLKVVSQMDAIIDTSRPYDEVVYALRRYLTGKNESRSVDNLLELSMGTNYSQKAFEAIVDWQQSTGSVHIEGPFFARMWGKDGAEGFVIFEIKNWYDGIALSLIKTPPEHRGKGLASQALKELLSFADKHGVPVTGAADPQPDEGKTLNKSQLKTWYKRHGFQFKRGDEMTRPPQNPTATKVAEALLEADEFDAKEYLMTAPSHEAFVQDLSEMGWKVGDLENHWGMEFVKDALEVSGFTCNLKLYVHPEFPHEAHVVLQASHTDDNGFEHWETIDQNLFWEMTPGESVAEYTARMEDEMARKLHVPDDFMDVAAQQMSDEDWDRTDER